MGKLTVGKIVATSTQKAWSQAYHAGGFTAVLSLTSKDPENPMSETELHKTGKEVLDTLIAEYFTLTTKDLETVKAAAQTTVEKVPEGYHLSMVVGAVVKNVLYLVITNAGKVLLKRGEKTGTLLQMDGADDEHTLESVSGYVEQDDILILQTEQFREVLPEHELIASLDHHSPLELAEMIAPKIHEAQNGGASALLFLFQEEQPSSLLAPSLHEEKEEEKPHAPTFFAKGNHEEPEPKEEEEESSEKETEIADGGKFEEKKEEKHGENRPILSPFPTLPAEKKRGFSLSHMQKMFLTVAVILAGVLMASIILFTTRQQQQQQASLFQSIYNPAKEKYTEGQSLVELNPTLAISDFQSAKDMLSGAQGKFPAGSSDAQQIASLLSQVTNSLTDANQANSTQLTKAADNASPLLTFQMKQQTKYVAEDTTDFYAADNNGVTATNRKTSTAKQIIKNSASYASLGGFGEYLGNFYILDQKDGILKYTSSGATYTKSSYFTGKAPDLSKAISIAIDGSIWVLSSDGTVSDYLRGSAVPMALTGLTKPLSNPSTIVTTADDTNIYILDNGNDRVVVVSKKGAFVAEYNSTLIKNAAGLDVDEANKTAYILSGNTIYQLSLQ
ncbi:MAG TPA: hypothetical protein VN711_05065 [Candidatus Saccharimonadales bacterium]|nr:hypothetical protein [Candidatus Saccharimonadales bacterium]